MKKRILTFTTFAAVAFLAGCSQTNNASVADGSTPVATIGDKTITQNDLYSELKSRYGDIQLRALILETVLESSVDDAAKLKEEAVAEVAKQEKEVGGEEAFKQLLAYQNLGTKDEFTQQLYVRNLLRAAIEKNIDTSDEAIKKFYDNDYSPLMEAQHILVDTEEEAKAAIERIHNGEVFDKVAQELSKDSTAARGGLLSPFKVGATVPEFESAVRGLKNGEMTAEPVKSKYGYHVIKAINNGEKAPFDSIKDEVKTNYIDTQFANGQVQNKVLSELVKNAKIDIKDSSLKDAIKDLLEFKPKEEASSQASSQPASSEQSSEESKSDE